MPKFKSLGIPTTNGISLGIDVESRQLAFSTTGPSGFLPVSGATDNIPTKVSQLENDKNFITLADIPNEVQYVTEFPVSGIANTMYINSDGEIRVWIENDWKKISYEFVDSIISGDPSTVPTTKAVFDFVNENIPVLPENITTQGNIFNTENNLVKLVNGKIPSGLYDAITSETQHIFEVTEFATSGLVANSLYIKSNTNETKFYNGSDYIDISLEAITSLSGTVSDTTVVTSKAIKTYLANFQPVSGMTEYVKTADLPVLPENITTQGNTFNTNDNLVKLVNGKIPSGLYDAVGGDVQHIYYIDNFPTANFVANTIYIHKTTNEIKFSDGNSLTTVVLPVSTNLTNANDTTIPTTLAVKTAIDNIEIPSTYVLPVASVGKLGGVSPDNVTCKTDANGVLSIISSDVESTVSTSLPLSGIGTIASPITLNINTDDFAIVNNKLTAVEKIVVESDFPTVAKTNSLYINSDNQTKVYDGTQWRDLSVGVVESISGNVNNDVVATSKAVNDFVIDKIAEIPSAQIPEISVDIVSDILSNDKTVSPKAVSKYIAENVNTLPSITENNSFLISKLGSGTDADDNTNDLNTVFLMQNGVLENVAAGKPAGSSCDFSGITSDGDYFIFNGMNWIVFNNGKFGPFADSLESYTIDMKFVQTSRSYIQYPFGPQDNSWPQGFITADGTGIQPYQNDNLRQNFTADTEVTFSMAYDATTKTCWTWLNGGTPVSGDWSSHTTTTATQFFIGRNTNLASDTGLIGKMKYFRISKVCRYSGKTFTPPVAAYGDIYTTWEERSAVDAKTILGITDGLTMYNASVADDGKVTLLNTNVTAAEMNIGDEINVLSGNTALSIPSGSVYIRTIKQIGASAGTSILVKGISTPAAANGIYNQLPAVDGEDAPTWKHESANYWIMPWMSTYWCITANETIENPGSSLFYATRNNNNPWDITNWIDVGGSYITGEFAVEKYNPVVNDNISLFYSLSSNSSGGITSGLQLETVDVFPTSGVNNTLYIDSTSSAKIYANDKWNEISSAGLSEEDLARLLPTTASAGQVPVYTVGVSRGNDDTCRLLVQPSTSNSTVVDSAAGNAAPVPITNNGITVSSEGNMVFNGSSVGIIAGGTLAADSFGANDSEFTIDIMFKCTDASRTMQALFGRDSSPRCDILLHTDTGLLEIGGGPKLGTVWTVNEWQQLTLEVWKDPNYTDGMTVSAYRNGALVATSYWSTSDFRANDLYIGCSYPTSFSRGFIGEIKGLRLKTGAEHRGTSFAPQTLPWKTATNAWVASTPESNGNLTFRIPKIVNDVYSLEIDLSDLGSFTNNVTINSTTDKAYFGVSTGLAIEPAPSGITDPYSQELLFFDLKSYIEANTNVSTYKYFRFRWKNSAGDYSSYGFGKTNSMLQVFNHEQQVTDEITYAVQKTEATTNNVVFKNDKLIYKIEVSGATVFTFDVSQLDTEECYTFELWVHMSTPVTLTFPSDSAWIDGTAPDMSESGLYCIVIRKLPAMMVTHTIQSPKLMMNLAYKYAITLV